MSTPNNFGANVYTQGFGSSPLGSFGIIPITAPTAPSSTNVTGSSGPLKLGQMWIDTSTSAIYFLAGLTSFNGTTSALWEQATSSTGNVQALQPDTGGPVFPLAGIIRVVGNANQLLSTGSGNTLAFSFTNGISIGAYASTVPPVGGLLMPGALVIGTSSYDGISLVQLNASTGDAYGIILQGSLDTIDGGGQQFGIISNATIAASSSSALMVGISSRNGYVTLTGQTTDLSAGLEAFNNYTDSAGTITNAIGVVSNAGVDTAVAGTITNGYGGYFNAPAFGTNKTALYADNISSGVVASGVATTGTFRSAPPDSNTATTTLGAITFATPIQNTLGYDVLISGSINIAAITTATVFLGVGPSGTPVGSAITESITSATPLILGFSAYVPMNYFLYLHATGVSITVTSVTYVATPV